MLLSLTDLLSYHQPVSWSVSTSSTLQATLSLNCLVLGETRQNIFPVEIVSSENVYALRKAIKDERPNAFCGVDADKLILFRTSKGVEALAGAPVGGNTLSRPWEALSEIFNMPLLPVDSISLSSHH